MNVEKKDQVLRSYSFIHVVKRILGMAFAAGPIYIIVNNLMAIVNGISQGVITFVTQKFFDTVLNTITLNEGVKKPIIMAFLLVFIMIISQVINGVNNFMGLSYFKKVTGYLQKKINQKAAKIYPISYENPETLNDINKAAQGAGNSLGLLFTVTTLFTYYTPYFLFMFFYLFSMDRMLAITLVFVFLPVAASQLVRSIVFSKLEDHVAPIRRESDYYKLAIGNKETRILGAYTYFKDLYISTLKFINEKSWFAERKVGLLELFMKVITLMGYLLILFLFVRSLLKGTISVAEFAAVFASIDYMFNTMNVIIGTHIADMTKNMGTINNFLRFLDMPEKTGEEQTKNHDKGIDFQNVSFSYPNSEAEAVRNISIHIGRGEIIAIVGKNGSGKTTFAKLALGIYEPDYGDVVTSGVNTRDSSSETVNQEVSAVFQNYQKYKMTLKENINISSIYSNDEKKIEESIQKIGINLSGNTFPAGKDTMLSREFDGVELSGGQWQKVAIARGIYRQHEIIVLDEPTAAIDPVEEANLYRKFAEISKDKTALIITHRLGSTKIANRIIVMDQGEIVEIGTHEKLMEQKKIYYHMYLEQAKWYQEA